MSVALLGATLVAYFAASVLYLANLHVRHRYLAGYGTAAMTAGLILQTVRLGLQTAHYSTPFANAQEAIFFLSWAISAGYLAVLLKYRLPALGALAMPLSVIALALVYRFSDRSIADDAWLRVHIAAIIASFALCALAFCSAVFYLVQNRLLKSKRLNGMFRKLPPLETVDSIAHLFAALGFPLMMLGIITGIVGVETSRVRAQASEMRLMVSLVTWAVYVIYLFAHRAVGWRGRRANWVLIVGGGLIMLTTALHKFAWGGL